MCLEYNLCTKEILFCSNNSSFLKKFLFLVKNLNDSVFGRCQNKSLKSPVHRHSQRRGPSSYLWLCEYYKIFGIIKIDNIITRNPFENYLVRRVAIHVRSQHWKSPKSVNRLNFSLYWFYVYLSSRWCMHFYRRQKSAN